MSTLGKRIKEYRLKRGYTQSQMADRLGMTEANFSSYERDKSKPPSEKLSQISSLLDVSADYLLFGVYSVEDFIKAKLSTLRGNKFVDDNFYFLLKSSTRIVHQYENVLDTGVCIDACIRGVHNSTVWFDETKGASFPTFVYRCMENEVLLILRSQKQNPETTYSSELTKKEERDIATDLERIMSDLETDEALVFHGEPIDEEERELLKRSLENSLILARQIAKKKFTPKKYRD